MVGALLDVSLQAPHKSQVGALRQAWSHLHFYMRTEIGVWRFRVQQMAKHMMAAVDDSPSGVEDFGSGTLYEDFLQQLVMCANVDWVLLDSRATQCAMSNHYVADGLAEIPKVLLDCQPKRLRGFARRFPSLPSSGFVSVSSRVSSPPLPT